MEVFFHLFVSALIFFLISILLFSLYRSFISLLSCIPRHFLCVVIVNGIAFLIWHSVGVLVVYRSASDFYTLIFYSETLLKLLISLRSFRAETMGFYGYRIMSTANKDSLTSSLPI